MKRILLLTFLFLGYAVGAQAQSTTVSGTVTDAGAQVWFGGTYSFQLVPNQNFPNIGQYTWTGGALSQVISGALDGSGHYSRSIPSNSAILPPGSTWIVTFCPLATSSCSTTANTRVTGGTQTISATPPAIAIALSSPGPFTKAYSDAEIVSAVVAAQYYNLTTQLVRVCQTVVVQSCTVWANVGGTSTALFSGAPTGPCSDGQQAVNTLTGDFYSCVGGAWIKVGPGGNPGVLVSPVITPNPLNLDVNVGFKGPNPYVDITRFGARTCDVHTTPCAGGLTATMSSGSAVATISSASTFINGDGVVVYGAGTASGLTVPTGLAITNVLAQMGTGTGLTVPSASGSTTTCYKIIARTTGGGYTAATSEVCTTTGLVARGAVTVNVSSCTRAVTLVTCTTSASTPLLIAGVGAEAYIGGTPSDSSFRGWRTVAATDATHFTFTDTAINTGNGATTSSTGGTVTFYAANHLSWNAVTNAWLYYIYGGASGAETLIGVSRPQNGAIPATDTTFDDFGSDLMSNMSFPSWIPTMPPAVAANNNLSTTILSGAGTTTLTLSANAGANVSGAGVRLDAGPGLVAAAATNNAGMLFIPDDPSGNRFVINSYTDLTPYRFSVLQSGGLWLHETIALKCSGLRYIGDRSTAAGQLGGGGANTWGFYPKIYVEEAVPGIYLDSSNSCTMEGINFQGVVGNGVLLMLAEQGFNINFKDVNWTTYTASTDKMGFGLILRESNGGGQSSSGIIMDKVSFGTGTQIDGATHNTAFFCNGCGDAIIRSAFNVTSGYIFRGNSSGANLKIVQDHYNGGYTPFISVGGASVGISLAEAGFPIIIDTVGHSCVSAFYGSVQVFNSGCVPSGYSFDSPSVTGTVQFATSGFSAFPAGYNNSLSSQTQTAISSQANIRSLIFNVTGPGGISVGYNSDSIFVNGPPPAAPTCSVSAGGSVPIGTWNFVVQPLWWNNLEGTPSPQSTGCTTTGGNQTITVNWTPVGGNPKGYYVFAGNGGGHASFGGNPFAPNVTSTIWSSGSVGSPVENSTSLGGPTSLLPGNQGMVAPTYLVSSSSGSVSSITSGAGVPAGGLCTTSKGGSIYLRTDGTTTTTFYVCDGATGSWTAK